MKFVAIADTHGKHQELILPKGDVLIHAGDVSMRGTESEILSFLDWFSRQEFEHKIFIAGNHDFYFEKNAESAINEIIPIGVTYLMDSQVVINGIKIWGSPITPWFFNWAFNRHRGEPIRRNWNLIPLNTNVLITHGPVFRKLDTTWDGRHVGCKDLFAKLEELDDLKVHICGHIHESYGCVERAGKQYINASVVNRNYEISNAPVTFDL